MNQCDNKAEILRPLINLIGESLFKRCKKFCGKCPSKYNAMCPSKHNLQKVSFRTWRHVFFQTLCYASFQTWIGSYLELKHNCSSNLRTIALKPTHTTVAVWTQKQFTPLLTRPQGSQGCQKIRIFFFTKKSDELLR